MGKHGDQNTVVRNNVGKLVKRAATSLVWIAMSTSRAFPRRCL